MQTGSTATSSSRVSRSLSPKQELFQKRFQSSVRRCVRRGFSVAECFGLIWLETLEELSLSDREQFDLYDGLLHWAKMKLTRELEAARPGRSAPGRNYQGKLNVFT